ncbi:MAG: prephenate dehydrogenase [Clostridia bacterium]|nr:prephenate dehydrogenase [Clostridia bacterium]
MTKDKKILIVGLGLLGGSYARALTKKGFAVSALTGRQSSVDFALKEGIIARGAAGVDEAMIAEADLVIFALYPHVFLEWIGENGRFLRQGAFLTDVTGVKEGVVEKVQAMLPPGVEFIAAHPMAGREVYGVENSDDGIFRGANYIVVPTEKNTPEGVALCRELGELLGFARVTELTPRKHDEMIAFVSQLTHCIAVSLMCACDDPGLVDYTGDSFRDLTRIARINEDMWSELFLLNRPALLMEMDRFKESFDGLYEDIRTGNVADMKERMRLSTARRALFDRKG